MFFLPTNLFQRLEIVSPIFVCLERKAWLSGWWIIVDTSELFCRWDGNSSHPSKVNKTLCPRVAFLFLGLLQWEIYSWTRMRLLTNVVQWEVLMVAYSYLMNSWYNSMDTPNSTAIHNKVSLCSLKGKQTKSMCVLSIQVTIESNGCN